MTDAICRQCGRRFAVPEHLATRYPGWTPDRCPDCFRSGRSGGEQARSAPEPPADSPDTGVFTDGAASPNPGPGGWGAVYVVDGQVVAERAGTEGYTTNNRMELTAILEGIRLVPDGTAATIYTDSKLAERTVNEWADGWARRGWRRKTGPVENLDLVQALYEAVQARPDVSVRWIKGHAGHVWNEHADALATGRATPEG